MLKHKYKVPRRKFRLLQWKYRYYYAKSRSKPITGTRKRKNNSVKKQVFDKVSRDDSDDDVMELGDDDDDDDKDGLDVDQEYYDSLEFEDEDDICCEMEEEEKGSVSGQWLIDNMYKAWL